MPTIRSLTPADAESYVALRREMLLDAPWAFGASPGQDRGSDLEGVRSQLADTAEYAIVGAMQNVTGPLLAAAGIMRDRAHKRRHTATIWGVYVTPAARGQGLGKAVVNAAIGVARAWHGVARVQLSASENSRAARLLYQSVGFTNWGIEPDCIRLDDGRSFAEHHMSLHLS